jgi:hypothetical protein
MNFRFWKFIGSSLDVHFSLAALEKHPAQASQRAQRKAGYMKDDEFLLWQMEPGIGLYANIIKSFASYETKSGQKADLVFVNPVEVLDSDVIGFEIQRMKNVQPGTLWVGRKNNDNES